MHWFGMIFWVIFEESLVFCLKNDIYIYIFLVVLFYVSCVSSFLYFEFRR